MMGKLTLQEIAKILTQKNGLTQTVYLINFIIYFMNII